MPKLLGAKAGKLSITDALLIAVAKVVSERVSAPFIGNATLFSGALKVGGAFVSNKLIGGRIGDIMSTALLVDGTEDVIASFIGRVGGGVLGIAGGGVELI